MSDDNKQGAAEPSPASTGSVAGEPDAWMHVSGGLSLGVFKHVDPGLRHLCVPIYQRPPVAEKATTARLTDAEREAVRFCVTASLPETQKLGGVAGELCMMHAAALRGLLERMGGGR